MVLVCVAGSWTGASFAGNSRSVRTWSTFVCWNERLVIEIDGGQHDASEGPEKADRTR